MSAADTRHSGLARHSNLPDLPRELLLIIHSFLDTKASFALIQVSRNLYNTLSDLSYAVYFRDDPMVNYPLWWAVERMRVKLARKALRHGAKPNEYVPPDVGLSSGGAAPLMAAIETGCTPMVELLMRAGADLTTGANNYTAFTTAVLCRHVDIVLFFLRLPRPFNFVDSHDGSGNTALHVAAEEGFADLVQVLLTHGARVGARNLKGCTPLHLALTTEGPRDETGNPVELLLKAGSDPLCKDFKGRDAFHIAAECDFTFRLESDREVVNLKLVMAALQVSVGGQLRLSIPRARLYWLLTEYDYWVVSVALEAGAPANTSDEYGYTALSYWANTEYRENPDAAPAEDVISILLEHGADIDACDPETGQTPLMGAALNDSQNVIELLLREGANVNLRDKEGMTALAHAAASSPSCTMKILLDHYRDQGKEEDLREHLESKDAEGLTLLLAAIVNGRIDTAELLIEYGADANATDRHGRSAYSLSTAGNYWDMARKLQEYGAHVDDSICATSSE